MCQELVSFNNDNRSIDQISNPSPNSRLIKATYNPNNSYSYKTVSIRATIVEYENFELISPLNNQQDVSLTTNDNNLQIAASNSYETGLVESISAGKFAVYFEVFDYCIQEFLA